MQTFLIVVASILALQNLIASVGVVLSAAYSPSQKCLQLLLIWLVPVFGAGIALYFLRENFSIKKRRTRTEGSLTTPGYDFSPPN